MTWAAQVAASRAMGFDRVDFIACLRALLLSHTACLGEIHGRVARWPNRSMAPDRGAATCGTESSRLSNAMPSRDRPAQVHQDRLESGTTLSNIYRAAQ